MVFAWIAGALLLAAGVMKARGAVLVIYDVAKTIITGDKGYPV